MAALGSVGSAVVLVSLKIFLTVATGSLGVLSEALHSSLDLIAAILTYLSVRVSDRPADAGHPYGHGKFENFSAFVETGLLLLDRRVHHLRGACSGCFSASACAAERAGHRRFSASPWASMWFARGRSAAWRGNMPSEALEADALHFSTDVWSTLVVILGIGAVWLGERTGIDLAALCRPARGAGAWRP